ncbi:MAG: hypothetical protein HKL80_02310, partial [Acidimicrobiales bacterium]|nr:hypothetical protein [Acidimicrobiales bacterium]
VEVPPAVLDPDEQAFNPTPRARIADALISEAGLGVILLNLFTLLPFFFSL